MKMRISGENAQGDLLAKIRNRPTIDANMSLHLNAENEDLENVHCAKKSMMPEIPVGRQTRLPAECVRGKARKEP